MTTAIFCAAAFVGCLLAGNRSLKHGLLTLIGIGYVYGILRANFPDVWTYLMFDAAVIGLFVTQLWRPVPLVQRRALHDLRLWMMALIGWPVALFILFPSNTPLVELVGLRGNVFLVPFLYLGARLTAEDLVDMATVLGIFNLAVVGVAIAQFFIGIEAFYPVNEVTEIIYKSKDLLERTAYRIPGTFSSAHAFAGTLVMTLPLLVGAWSQKHRERWRGPLLAAAIVAALLGIFMAAARTHMITAAIVVVVVTFSGSLGGRQWLRWAVVVGVVGYIVAGDARFQRFTTLQDTAYLADRWGGSVNEGFFDLVGEYPLGNGLAGGGTSVPYFLRGDWNPGPIMENEYARIVLEQGLPGLALWLLFITWVLLRSPGRTRDGWQLARRLAWVTFAVVFASGLLGIGMFTSVPQTVVMLITMGWFVTARRRVVVAAPVPAPRRRLDPAEGHP